MKNVAYLLLSPLLLASVLVFWTRPLAAQQTTDVPEATHLWMAAALGDLEAIEEFLDDGVDVDEVDAYGRTPLAHAARWARTDAVTFLLKKRANVDAGDRQGKTPLSWTIEAAANPLETVELLIDARADVDAADAEGVTPLMVAARTGRADLVEILLDAGAKIGLASEKGVDQGLTALDLARRGGHREVVALLERSSNRRAQP